MFDASGQSEASSIRPNKTGTWLLIKCSFQKWTFLIKNIVSLISKMQTIANWVAGSFSTPKFDMKISKNTDNNIVYFIKMTFKFNQH